MLGRKLTAVLAAWFFSFGSSPRAQTAGYDQPFRPQVHFSPQQHWTNDPNGLVFFQGEYYLFYQYNPYGDLWGHMSWGHAVSTDLLHWHELPVAIPESDGVMIYTGSVVIDRENSTGLCAPGSACMVAVYTGASDTPPGGRQTQNLAFSRDNGRTWTKYAGNPVLDLQMADFRDPSVSWDEGQHRWLMAVSLPKEHKVRLYASPDLKRWTQLSDFGPAGDVDGDWECPDLLHVPAEDGKGGGAWVLKVGLNPGAPQGGSGEQYFLGDFDGKQFTAHNTPGAHGWTNYGKDDYCAISFNALPKGERPTLIGWMSNWQYAAKLPTAPWRGQMSLPRRLSFLHDAAGTALKQDPIVAPLRGPDTPLAVTLGPGVAQKVISSNQAPFELQLHFDPNAAASFGLRLRSDERHFTEIGFDAARQEFYIDRTHSGLEVSPEFPSRTRAPLAPGRPFDLHLIVDRSSVEAFAQNGTLAMTNLIFPPPGPATIEVFSNDGKPLAAKGHLWTLHPVWK